MSSLAGLRFSVERSLGRRYPEPRHSYRCEFQRDRDRIIHSRAFRRLENKTQVFTSGYSDHFRNRLTHTIEVTQIARTVASVLELNEELTEALALVHDVGHPPFAHAGEEELNRQMQRFGESFNHNFHGLRVVDQFEHRYVRFTGLNLTFEVREGILKHSRDLTPGTPGTDEYLPDRRPPLEAQLIDLADEIAYNTADLDDGYSARMFSISDLRHDVPQFDRRYDELEGQFPGAPERVLFQEVIRGIVDTLVSGLIAGTVTAAELACVRDVEDVRACRNRLSGFTAETRALADQLRAFLHKNVYFSEPLVDDRRRSMAMIAELFEFYLNHPSALPENYIEAAETDALHRVVCDYIAGMTDGFLERCYRELLSNV